MATNLAALPGKLKALGGALEKGKRDTVMDAALFAKDEFLKGPPRSGLRRGGSLKWGVGFDLKPGTDPTALVKYRGPVHWTEQGTDAHVIRPKKRRRKQALAFDGIVRATVRHPGQKAKPFFGTVESKIKKGAPKILQANLRSNIGKAGFGAVRNLR